MSIGLAGSASSREDKSMVNGEAKLFFCEFILFLYTGNAQFMLNVCVCCFVHRNRYVALCIVIYNICTS